MTLGKAITRMLVLLGVPLGVIFLYALVHEGGHALVVLLFGGTVTEFQVNFFRTTPHVSYVGITDPLQRALVSLGGPVLPLMLVMPIIFLLRKARNIVLQGTLLLCIGSVLPTVLVSMAISLAYGFGAVQSSEDVAKFILYSGFNPFVVAGAFLILFVAVVVFLHKARVQDIAIGVVKSLRESQDRRPPVLVGKVIVVMLLLAIGAGVIRNTIRREAQVSQPLSYHTKFELDLKDIKPDSTIYHTFKVVEPTTFDFIYTLETNSEVTLSLINLEGIPFPFNNHDSIVMYQGSESLQQAYFSGFTLLAGDYALAAAGSSGLLTMYIDSKEPSTPDLQYLQLLAEVNDGTFTAQSYQEEGYELIYQGSVPKGADQLLVTLPGGGGGRSVSAFAVGPGGVSLIYVADGKTHTLLEGFRATMGRGLPPHRGQGEIRVTAPDGDAMLYIFVN